MTVSAIQAEELKQRLDAGENLLLLDVREEDEYEISNIGGQLIPLAELPKRVQELDASREIIAKAVQILRRAGFPNVRSLTGGIDAWSDRVAPGPARCFQPSPRSPFRRS